MRRALTAEHVYGLIVSGYQTEAEALHQHSAGTNKNCMQGWLLAAMEAATLATEVATKAALPIYAAKDPEQHDWIREYCRQQTERFRQRVNHEYSGNYLQIIKHSADGLQELKKQNELKTKIIDIDKVYRFAIAGKGLTEETVQRPGAKSRKLEAYRPQRAALGTDSSNGSPDSDSNQKTDGRSARSTMSGVAALCGTSHYKSRNRFPA